MTLVLFAALAGATTLEEAWAAAERGDLQVRMAEETAIQAGTLPVKAWSALSPRVSGHAAYVINQREIAIDFTDGLPPELQALIPETDPTIVQQKTFWQGDVTASARLFSGSALPGLRGAYALHHAARADTQAARQSSRRRVAEAYYGVLAARRAEELARGGVELAAAQQVLAERQRDAGMAGERAVLQARLGVSQAERDAAAAREGVVAAETGFELLTGLAPDNLELPPPFQVPQDVPAAIAAARRDRPDVHAIQYRERAARLGTVGHGLTWLPVVDAVASYNYTQNTGLMQTEPWQWRVVLQGTWDLWDGGLRVANQIEAASQVRAAELGRALIEDSAERDVRLAFEAHARAQAALEAVESDRALAEESLRLAEAGWTVGQVTFLEVQGARLQLQATELAILRERMARDLAAIALLQGTGQL